MTNPTMRISVDTNAAAAIWLPVGEGRNLYQIATGSLIACRPPRASIYGLQGDRNLEQPLLADAQGVLALSEERANR